MQVICTLALHHPLTAISHEVTLRYVEQMQDSSLSCFAVGLSNEGLGGHWNFSFKGFKF